MQNCEKGTAYVLPAFETYGTNMSVAAHTADILITTNKQALVCAMRLHHFMNAAALCCLPKLPAVNPRSSQAPGSLEANEI